jgi:hypothetical protein
MTTTKQEISGWFDRGVAEGATHMVVVCDTYDWEDYPVFVRSPEEAKRQFQDRSNMQKGMEVYNLSMPKDEQLSERRCVRY